MASPDPRVTPGIYDQVYDTLFSMPSHLLLATSEYGVDFKRHVGARNNWSYVEPGSTVAYETILVGEVRPSLCGTRFSAKGTHYLGSFENPTFIEDDTRVKSLFVLGKPSNCTKELGKLFDNQLCTLRSVIDDDLLELNTNKKNTAKKNITFKEWTSHAGSDTSGDPDYINVVTEAMYVTPKSSPVVASHSRKKHALTERPRREEKEEFSLTASPAASGATKKEQGRSSGRRGKNVKRANVALDSDVAMDFVTVNEHIPYEADDGDSTNTACSSNTSTPDNITTNDVYRPTVLPDYGGDLFKHVNAKLRQLDFRDVDDKLIPPQKWYSVLRQGTLVMVRATLHAFNWETRRVILASLTLNFTHSLHLQVYQLNAHTIKVLDGSSLEVEDRKVMELPSTSPRMATSSDAAKAMSTILLGKRPLDDTT